MKRLRLAVVATTAGIVVTVVAGPAGAAAPTNDDFANRISEPAAPLPISAAGDTTDATVEPGEPEHAGDEGGASVWYEWTPAANGTYEIDTSGSSFDTLVAVYTGAAVAGLGDPPVAFNDDAAV